MAAWRRQIGDRQRAPIGTDDVINAGTQLTVHTQTHSHTLGTRNWRLTGPTDIHPTRAPLNFDLSDCEESPNLTLTAGAFWNNSDGECSGVGARVAFSGHCDHLSAMKLAPHIEALVHEAMALPGDPARHRVVCAMSGGVDSSVAAALLKMAGYDVVGITLQLYDHGEAIRRKGACCAGQDIHDARRVAAAFDIPHYVLDFESRFREAVIDDFVNAYVQGATPIPCVQVQSDCEIRRPALAGPRTGCQCPGDGSLYREPRDAPMATANW